MGTRSLLAVFGHPDDESFGCGGTLAGYAKQGVRVALVCATRGEAGEISDPSLATRDTLADVREAEMNCAAEALALDEMMFLDYRDSGMDGTADNGHPRAFARAPADEVVSRLVGIIRRLKPQVVLTFDPHGGYGHPDHIAAHRHTVAAFNAADDPTSYPEQGPPWQPGRLLYAVIPNSGLVSMRDRLKAVAADTSQLDQFEELGAGWPDDQVHAVLDVSAAVDAKWKAVQCHASQLSAGNPFTQLPEAETKELMGREYFAVGLPSPADGLRLDDLFDGI